MKNITVYNVAEESGDVQFDLNLIPSLIHTPLTSLQQEKTGFTPLYEDVLFNKNIDGYFILKLKTSKRAPVKGDTLSREYESRIKELERKEISFDMDTLFQEVEDDLTRMANISSKDFLVVFDTKRNTFYFDCNQATAEAAKSTLEQLLPDDVVLNKAQPEPLQLQKMFTNFITDHKTLPDSFELGEKITLGKKAIVGKNAPASSVSIKNEYIASDEVRKHIDSGKLVHSLEVDGDGMMYFVVDHKMAISSVKFEEHLDYEDDESLDEQDNFEAKATLQLNEISKVLDILFDKIDSVEL